MSSASNGVDSDLGWKAAPTTIPGPDTTLSIRIKGPRDSSTTQTNIGAERLASTVTFANVVEISGNAASALNDAEESYLTSEKSDAGLASILVNRTAAAPGTGISDMNAAIDKKRAPFSTPPAMRNRKSHRGDGVYDDNGEPLSMSKQSQPRLPLYARSGQKSTHGNNGLQTSFGVTVVTPATLLHPPVTGARRRASSPTPPDRRHQPDMNESLAHQFEDNDEDLEDRDAIQSYSPGLMSGSRSILFFDDEPVKDVEGGFSGWGSVTWIDDLWDEKSFMARLGVGGGEKKSDSEPGHGGHKDEGHAKIGQWTATAIAANDLMGSILYTVGVTTQAAGKFAPISLMLVCISLFVFRRVIQEVGVTVPMNGGSYSAMMLFSNKVIAAIVACCTLLDYIATALVSAASASAYASSEFGSISTFWVTLAILFFFSILTMFGVKESSKVSLAILLLHVATIITVAIAVLVSLFSGLTSGGGVGFGDSVLGRNVASPSRSGSVFTDIFFGYCVGMVGVTGFEASINYVEEQAPGVFPKTLRNMCYLVLFCNPILSILALSILPIPTILANSDVVISVMAAAATTHKNIGEDYVRDAATKTLGWLTTIVAVDAVIVLCGGVLTAFVGVCGLIEVMALDNILPPFLLYRPPRIKAQCRRPDTDDLSLQRFATDASLPTTRAPKLPSSPHFTQSSSKSRPLIPLSFLLLCTLLYVIVGGSTTLLGLVFAMAFLSVLASFVAVSAVEGTPVVLEEKKMVKMDALAGGGLWYAPTIVATFLTFFMGLFVFMYAVHNRVRLVRLAAVLVCGQMRLDASVPCEEERGERREGLGGVRRGGRFRGRVLEKGVFYDGEDPIHDLNSVIHYVLINEPSSRLVIVHCYEREEDIPGSLEANCITLDHVYPNIRLDLVFVKAKFSVDVIGPVAKRIGVHRNMCLASCKWNHLEDLSKLKGVRLILL
ncbi:amino acid permease-domain-containing protein [Chytridium lagenaria]|nr:amino acid permease-domain-containing protein [Chytridium lagenaria]